MSTDEKFKRSYNLVKNPTIYPQENREYLKEHFGVPAPASKTRSKTVPAPKPKHHVLPTSLAPHPPLPTKNNFASTGDAKTVSESDLEHGVMGLIEHGLLPKQMDITPYINHAPYMMVHFPAVPHKFKDKFKKRKSKKKNQYAYVKFDATPTFETPVEKVVDQKLALKSSKKTEKPAPSSPPMVISITEPTPMTPAKSKQEPHYPNFVVIRGPKGVEHSPEYRAFHETHLETWGPIITLLNKICRFVNDYDYPLVYVDTLQVANLAQDELSMPNTTEKDIRKCIFVQRNGQLVSINAKTVKKYPDNVAATIIQKTWRMHVAIQLFHALQLENFHANKIKAQWMLRCRFLETRRRIRVYLKQLDQSWREKMKTFKTKWPKIDNERTVILHVASLSFLDITIRKRMSHLEHLQNSQLLRLFDPNVDMIYVSTHPIQEEALRYMIDVLCADVDRITFVYPDLSDAFPKHTALSSLVTWSQYTVPDLQRIVDCYKYAYFVPSMSGNPDLRLALKLQIPMLGTEPALMQKYGTKSGCRDIFAEAGIATPPGMTRVTTKRDLCLYLSKLIIENLDTDYTTFLIKIDHPFCGSIAVTETCRMKCLSTLGRQHVAKELPNGMEDESFLDVLRDKLYHELFEFLQYRMSITTSIFPTWNDYMEAFQKVGGVIEVIPSQFTNYMAHLFIDPVGIIRVDCIHEVSVDPQYESVGCIYDHQHEPPEIRIWAQKVAKVCFEKGIISHVSILFTQTIQELWGVELFLYPTDNALITKLVPKTPCSYLYSGILKHQEFFNVELSSLVQVFKHKNLYYNPQTNTGVLFHLIDSIKEAGAMGMVCMGNNLSEAAATFGIVLELLGDIFDDDFRQSTAESNMNGVRELVSKCIAKCTRRNSSILELKH